ncbi:MAG: L-rhamnose/proton symporter RhaT [Bryobacteraceae bacterium]
MINQVNLAVLLAALGGVLQGSFTLPMKRMESRWRWENTWLIYSIVGLIVFPCVLTYLTIPAWREVYSVAPSSSLAVVALFGLGWGVGSTLFGLGVSRVGMALAFAIILGLTSSFGTLLPLLVMAPAELFTTRGLMLGISLLLVIGGIGLLATAGSRRDRERRSRMEDFEPGAFRTGMIICIAAGLLSPMLNFSFVFGKPVQDAAVVFGARPDLAANAIWAPALAGGFLPNALYPLYLLFSKKTWGNYTASGVSILCFLGAAVMGLLWYGGISLYGVGAAMMGSLGGVLGWPIFMSMNIIVANILGLLTGEWVGASPAVRRLSWAGIGVLVVAIVVVAMAGQA